MRVTLLYPCLTEALRQAIKPETHVLSPAELHEVTTLFRSFCVEYDGIVQNPHYEKTALYAKIADDTLTVNWSDYFGDDEEWYTKVYSLSETLNKPFPAWIGAPIKEVVA